MGFIGWAVVNVGMFAALWFGLARGMDGPLNVGLFLVWYVFATSFLLFLPGADDLIAKNPKSCRIPVWIELTYDVAVIVLLVWFGRNWAGAAYTFHMMVNYAFVRRVNAIREKAAKANKVKS